MDNGLSLREVAQTSHDEMKIFLFSFLCGQIEFWEKYSKYTELVVCLKTFGDSEYWAYDNGVANSSLENTLHGVSNPATNMLSHYSKPEW